jgi:hypothetical protein
MVKTSWHRLVAFSQVASSYLRQYPGNTKLSYALNKALAQINSLNNKVQQELIDIDIEYCATQKRGEEDIILKDAQGNLEYSKDGMKSRNRARQALLDREIEFQEYFATKIPAAISDNELIAFEGLVIDPEEVKRILDKRDLGDEKVESPESSTTTLM